MDSLAGGFTRCQNRACGRTEMDDRRRFPLAEPVAHISEPPCPCHPPARTDFWLYVHELNLCLEGEGVTIDEQQTHILDSLESMPPLARQEVIRELTALTGELMA